jgi:hypothetical protein
MSSFRRYVVRTLTTTNTGKSQYIHPLSKLVLEYFQTDQSNFLSKHGLDKGLHIENDGTFILKFPSYHEDKGRIW